MIDAERRLDPGLLQTQIGRVELVEARVLEGRVMQAGAAVLVRVVAETGEGQQGDPVVSLVVAEPGANVVLKVDLSADEDRVEIDHLLETGGLQVEVVELGMDHCRRVGHVSALLDQGSSGEMKLGPQIAEQRRQVVRPGDAAEDAEVGANQRGTRVVAA